MNKPITRWLSFLLAALMLFTQIPLAYASEPEAGDTDASSPGFLSIATDFPDNFLALDSQEPEKTITPIVLDDSGAVIPLEACTITCRLREDAEAFAWEVNPDNTVTVRPAAPEQEFRVELEITAQWGVSVGSCTVLVEYTASKETSASAAEQEEPTAETAYSEDTTLPPAEAPTEEATIPPEETVIPPEETAEAPAEEPAAEPPVSEGSEQEPAAEQTDPLPDSVPVPDEESDESFDIRDLLPEEELAEMTEEEIAWWQEQLLAGNIELLNVGSTQGSILLFNYTDNGNYTTYLNSQVSVTYRPNGTDSAKTAYIKNMGWHFARYNNTPYPDSPLYCIEPYRDFGASTSGNKVDRDVTLTGSGSTQGSNVWYALPQARREAIGRVLLYSDQMWNHSVSVTNTPMSSNPNVPLRIATQMLIYEIVCGMREDGTFKRLSVNECGSSGSAFYNAGAASVSGFAEKYNTLVSYVQSSLVRPSFTGSTAASAPTIYFTGNSTTVTDSNGVLSQWSFQSGSGASFSKSGNTLTITKTGNISPSTVFTATQSKPSAANTTYNLWYMTGSSYQTTISLCSAGTETVSAYFKLDPPALGNLRIVKTTEDGKNLSGWQFGIYADAACISLVSGPHTTDASGNLTVSNLNAGTYYVKELGNSNASLAAQYVCNSTNPQKVTVTSGGTASVSFVNNLATGKIQIVKTTNTGSHLAGWTFKVKDSSGNVLCEITTDDTGCAYTELLPSGSYTITENPVEDAYWTGELGYHTVTVEPGKTAVDTWLNKEQGLGRFIKETNTGSDVTGWKITIYSDAACTAQVAEVTTGDDGRAGMYLDPGTYWAKETGHTDGLFESEYWQSDRSVQQLVIRPHEETAVTFQNTHCGALRIVKTMPDGGTLADWQFRITDSEGKEAEGSPFTTDAQGEILAGGLLPGEYTAEEILPENSPYTCTSENPQKVTIRQGETAELQFTNALRPARIWIEKVDTTGSHLPGAVFRLEWSEDGGKSWSKVFYSNTLVKGGCSSQSLNDGCLTSDVNGELEWANLYPGLKYRVTEVSAPEGYTKLKKPAFEDTITPEDLDITIRVINNRSFTLPKTGSNLLRIFSILAALACTVGILLTASSLKKKKRRY